MASVANLSGSAWWHANQAKYPNSTSVDDLEPGFRSRVKEFLQALKDAGVSDPGISTTRRSKQRAYLMHYSWQIAHGQVQASQVPAEPGVSITWDHGNDAKSRKGAQEMVQLFHMAHIAVLNSNHIAGKAIDMTFTWEGTLKIKDKYCVTKDLTAPRSSSQNIPLRAIGSSYGVYKLATDPPHWSADGH